MSNHDGGLGTAAINAQVKRHLAPLMRAAKCEKWEKDGRDDGDDGGLIVEGGEEEDHMDRVPDLAWEIRAWMGLGLEIRDMG